MKDKTYYSTKEGQREMCDDAASRSIAFMLTRKIKSMGGTGWDESWIATANPTLLATLKNELVEEYNNLLGQNEVTK